MTVIDLPKSYIQGINTHVCISLGWDRQNKKKNNHTKCYRKRFIFREYEQ